MNETHLEGAVLTGSRLQEAALIGAHLEAAVLDGAHLEGAILARAHFDGDTSLRGVILFDAKRGGASLADLSWGDANLAVVEWNTVPTLGDERRARGIPEATAGGWRKSDDDLMRRMSRRTRLEYVAEQTRLQRDAEESLSMLYDITGTNIPKKPTPVGRLKRRVRRAAQAGRFEIAVRANRQLATALRNQGLREHADKYAYRAQKLERQVLRRRHQWGRALGSWILDVIAGFGYKPMRSLIAYVIIICLFAGAYLLNAQFAAPHLTWDESLVLSISSFHGRGFFSSGISLGDTLARLAAGEAIIGLLIEITFIATFTQRFFAR